MIDLSWRRKQDIIHNLGSTSLINEELLHQCAYYPRPAAFGQPSPCFQCSMTLPNPKCKRSHILNFTFQNEPKPHPKAIQLNSVLKALSQSDLEVVLQYIRERRTQDEKHPH